MRGLSLLGQAYIIDKRAGGRYLGAGEIAKAVERADFIKAFEPPPSGIACETRIWQRCQGRLPVHQHFVKRRAGQQALGQ